MGRTEKSPVRDPKLVSEASPVVRKSPRNRTQNWYLKGLEMYGKVPQTGQKIGLKSDQSCTEKSPERDPKLVSEATPVVRKSPRNRTQNWYLKGLEMYGKVPRTGQKIGLESDQSCTEKSPEPDPKLVLERA